MSVHEQATTFLFVPGDRPERFDKARACGADVVVIDLEDAVTPERKPAARHAIRHWRDRVPDDVTVRISPPGTPEGDADVAMLAALPGLRSVVAEGRGPCRARTAQRTVGRRCRTRSHRDRSRHTRHARGGSGTRSAAAALRSPRLRHRPRHRAERTSDDPCPVRARGRLPCSRSGRARGRGDDRVG